MSHAECAELWEARGDEGLRPVGFCVFSEFCVQKNICLTQNTQNHGKREVMKVCVR